MNSKNVPAEGDCDICGDPLELAQIARNYDRHSGRMTCDYCAKIRNNKHLHLED
jgi:ssDNA-binding Zn-finger/Zn-ribbon topoisomerase 1